MAQRLKNMIGHNSPLLSGTLISLLLYADDVTSMSTTAAGLQYQQDAQCSQHQLSVNLIKTEVVSFEHTKSSCQDFTFDADLVERVQTMHAMNHKYVQMCTSYPTS